MSWISTETLPKNELHGQSRYVLICHEPHHLLPQVVWIAYYDYDRQEWRNIYGRVSRVACWQPLPEPPEIGAQTNDQKTS